MSIKITYKIGQKFIPKRGKVKRIETITDIYRTYNSKNELIKVEYATEHDFLGQIITGIALNTTIAMGELVN